MTRYEARACLRHHDFGRYARMLDIGGNSGEFVLQVCRRHPGLRGIVYDLPLVCALGREHVGREPEAGRVAFVEGNALADPIPAGFDLVAFKSMLHDWPEREAEALRSEAERLVDALWRQKSGPAEVVEALRIDRALSEPLRQAALRAVLRRAIPPETAPGNPP